MPTIPTLSLAIAAFASNSPCAVDQTVSMGDVVNANFRCTYLNGQIMDSTFGKTPLCIKVGWRPRLESFARLPFFAFDEGLVGMKVGEKKNFVIPAAKAFGPLQVGDVPPNVDLSIEVEVLAVYKKDAVPTTQIQEVKLGDGKAVSSGAKVAVHYAGTFLNGVPFDSNYGELDPQGNPKGDPMRFVVGERGLIKGFLDGLVGMKPGGIRKVVVPYNLAYTEKGSRDIPPFATLVFELRVLSVD